MDQTGKRIVGEVLGPLNQGQTVTLDCLVSGGETLQLAWEISRWKFF